MTSTLIVLAVYLGLFLVSSSFWGAFLYLGLKWAKVADVTIRGVISATCFVAILQFAQNMFFASFLQPVGLPPLTLADAYQVIAIALCCLVITAVFRTGIVTAAKAWLPTLVPWVGVLCLVFMVIRPHVYEAFVGPANSMAPTLLGEHWRGTCPECEAPSYGSPPRGSYNDSTPGICDNFHITEYSEIDEQTYQADRFLVSKLLTPKRWDLIVFRFPDDPSVKYVMRLVGLPGEEIIIRDGAVWADGTKLEPPDAIAGIEYQSDLGMPGTNWGSPDKPAKLRTNEYFVLGDFTIQANDSRLWFGRAGGNPYAVPESHIEGVVTHIYWPLNRCRVLR